MKKWHGLRLTLAALVATALLVAGCGGTTGGTGASGPKLPDQIRLIVPFGTGGSNDTAARVFAPFLKKELGVNVVVENIAGGSGNSGMSTMSDAKPDGATLATYFTPMLVLLPKVEKTGYEHSKITPIVNLTAGSEMLLAHKDSSYKDLKGVAKALAEGKDLTIGVAGFGTNAFIAVAKMKGNKEFAKVRIVPYQSGGEVNTALIGKQIDLAMVGSIAAVKPVGSGQLKALVIMGSTQLPEFPGVTTAKDQGFDGLAVDDQLGIVGPPGMDAQLVAKISAAAVKAAKDPDFVAQAKKAGLPLDVRGHEEYAKLLKALDGEVNAVVPVVEQIGRPSPAKK